ncbi:MAG: biosynthetic-type acetolactate synthase large subunit [Oscillospiraceae bacterium]|nr:biosynthetic-type acetolactate synthase large subunit [Oscillospiraceae bacterium]
MKITGADILIKELMRQGVDTVFGYPGGYVIDIYDELYKNADNIRHILPASEQGAAFAANAYARITDKPSVVLATGGPGATNLVTGIAAAYLDSVAVIFITGNVSVPMLGQDSFQDIDIVGCTLPIVKHSYIVKDICHLQWIIAEAFQIANTGRKGPVHIDIPKNVQQGTYDYDPNLKLSEPAKRHSDLSALDKAVSLIEKSKRPYIYSGGGVTATNTGDLIIKLSEMTGAPIGMSLMGIGSVPASYYNNLGMSGMFGTEAAVTAMREADLIIALGVRFSDRATGSAGKFAENTSVIHIDIDPAEIGKNIQPDVCLCGDLRDILPALLEKLSDMQLSIDEKKQTRISESPRSDNLTPQNIISAVNGHYDENTVVTTDVGQHQMWVAQNYRFEKPKTLLSSGGLGAMGYGLGAGVGASLAHGGKRTVLFTGDGSFLMNLSELKTAVTHKLPITIILFNNGTLGMVRQMQTLSFDKHYSSTTLENNTDYPALAKAFGAAGCTVNNITELKDALEKAPLDRPYLIECKIDIDEIVETS